MLSKTKLPPCEYVAKFLQLHGRPTGQHIICTDQDRELWESMKFKNTITAAGYLMEPTAPGAPFQNSLAEHKCLGII
jgi:hypothetical protein